ncbi:MAG: ParB N-terminal domain-containing protein [Actinomycetota bacterium]|nr:ParB N-terminal domain-containing protein [Actinomycetota bacterium]
MESDAKVWVKELEVDPYLQPRVGGTDPAHVRALEEAHDGWPPLKVVRQDGRYLLVDGFHRLEAARHLGLESVLVKVLEPPEDGDLRALAFSLNAQHGRPLSLADRRAFAERLLRDRSHLADREIGRRCGLSGNTVGVIRGNLEESAQIEQTAERVGRGGYRYTVGRRAGELPDPDPGAAIAELFKPQERRQQKRVAHYLERLAVALDDQYGLKGWETHDDAAEACREVLGGERADELARRLGDGAHNVLMAAVALGYDEDAETGE